MFSICKTPHHQYRTTVTLCMDRRLELIRLSEKYKFILFEDDYDFDFHYKQKPLLPLASIDKKGMVIYCGSFSKILAPVFRLGYLVASQNVIGHLAKIRLITDRQGDYVLENAMAELINEGIIQRYLRKAVKIYKERRDYFCFLLNRDLSHKVNFSIPDGGLAVWCNFNPTINLTNLSEKSLIHDLDISNGHISSPLPTYKNSIRLGFASSTLEELEESVQVLKKII